MGTIGNSHIVDNMGGIIQVSLSSRVNGMDGTPQRYGAFVELVAALSCLMGFVLIGDLGWKSDMFSASVGLTFWIPGTPF